MGWSYTPAAGGDVYAVENTFYNGNALDYVWIKADDSEVDAEGMLKGEIKVNTRCLDPCALEQYIYPLTMRQIGGFGAPKSTTTFVGLNLDNCTGPFVHSPGPPVVEGIDIPWGVGIRVQVWGGFGTARSWNASNSNLTGFNKPIANRLTREVNDSTNGFYVPWLKGMVPEQLSAGKKLIFERKFGEGNHIFEFAANKVGPSIFSVTDEAGCIRYWAVNVLASHCWDWTSGGVSVNNDGAKFDTVDITQKLTTLDSINTHSKAKTFMATKSNIFPETMDVDLVEKIYIQNNDTQDAFCDCSIDDADKTKQEASDFDEKAAVIEDLFTEAPILNKAGTTYIQTQRLHKPNLPKPIEVGKLTLQDIPRTITKNSRYLYVGENVTFKLPKSMYLSAATDEEVEKSGGIFKEPFLSDGWNPKHGTRHKGHGWSHQNTGPATWIRNDDKKIISATMSRRGDSVKVEAISPTNFLPAVFEVYHEDNGLWANEAGKAFYRYFAPTAPKRPYYIDVVDTDPGDDDRLSTITNNYTGQTNYLKKVQFPSDRISWTQSALFIAIVSMCPPIKFEIETERPWDNVKIKGGEIIDYGNGNEFKVIAKFPADFTGTVFGERFHVAEPDYVHRENSFFGMKALIEEPKNGSWRKPDKTGLTRNTGPGESDFEKSYALNSRIGENHKHMNSSSVALFCSWRSGDKQLVWGKHPVYSFSRMGPGSVAGDWMKDDQWLEFNVNNEKAYIGYQHISDKDSQIRMSFKRGYGEYDKDDGWTGIHEQPRGCNCMNRNLDLIKVNRKSPIIAFNDGIKEITIKNNTFYFFLYRGYFNFNGIFFFF